MFAKLMKYEFRATRKAMGVLCLTSLAMGVAGGGAWWINSASKNSFAKLVCGVILFSSFLLIAMCAAAAFFLMVARFYKRCFTDEGYLTFALPVSTHQVLLSSILNAAINMLIAVVVVILSYGILGLITCSVIENFRWIMELLPEIWASLWEIMDWELAGNFALLFVSAVMGCANEFITIMLCITIGTLIAKKHKILAAVGVYYGITLVMSIFWGMTMISSLTYIDSGMDTMRHLLLMPILESAALAVAFYFLTHYLITRKLNLP